MWFATLPPGVCGTSSARLVVVTLSGEMSFFFGGNLVPEDWRLSAGVQFGIRPPLSVRTQRDLSPRRQSLRVLGGGNARHVHLLPEVRRGGNDDAITGGFRCGRMRRSARSTPSACMAHDQLNGNYQAIATDYDGTLAHDGQVDEPTIDALLRARAAGLATILVTGRELADLFNTFAHAALFDRIVAENGAVLYQPATQQLRALSVPPPPRLLERLAAAGRSRVGRPHHRRDRGAARARPAHRDS